ncbi:MAG: HIT family protein [Candidatus Accumulibacter sp.]|nr:HIT family protein [Accumulibacter sp.]
MESCFYCEKNAKLDSIMIKIRELSWSIVYLNRNQALRGRIIVAFKDHKTEYFQLSAEERAGFFAEVCLAAEAIHRLFKPGKINYATFGDLVPHAHFHVVPKYADRVHWGKPYADEPNERLSDAEYRELIDSIGAEIDRLKK